MILQKRCMKEYKGSQWANRKREESMQIYRELDSILGHRPASVPAVLLDTRTTSNSSSAIEDPQGASYSAEEKRLKQMMEMMFEQMYPWTALVSGSTQSGTNDKEPGDETAPPPTKKPKVQKKSRAERSMEKAMESFMTYQREAEERYQKNEEEWWQKDIELEEKRRKEDQEQELRMLGLMFQGGIYHRQYEFDYMTPQHDNDDQP